MTKESRNKKLKLIHTQKRKLNLDDELYVTILLNTAGVDSASKLETPSQFAAVINALNAALEKHGLPIMGSRNEPVSPLVRSVLARAGRILGPSAETRIQGYLKKMGRASLSDCSPVELRRVQGFLSTIERSGGR